MSLTIRNRGDAYVLPPAGAHRARCFQVIDLGTQHNQKFANWSPKVLIGFELADELMEDGRPFTFAARFTASLSTKAKLRGMLESWRGRQFGTEELDGFSLEKLLNAPALITIGHDKSPDGMKTFANLKAISMLPKGTPAPPPLVNPPLHFQVEQGVDEVFEKLPEYLRKTISQCREWTKDPAPVKTAAPVIGDEGGEDNIPF